MNRARAVFVAMVFSLWWNVPLRAQDAELSLAEMMRMLAEVEAVKKRVGESRHGVHASSIQAFRNAAASTASAYQFYMKCYREFHFDRWDTRESEYRDWKEKNFKRIRSKEYSEALRLQLKFLVITLRAAQMTEDEEIAGLVPELTALIDSALAAYPHLGKAQEILHQDAVGSVFGQVYKLGSTLKSMPAWGKGPMDIAGIYEKTILPLYRSTEKADALSAAWDRRIAQASKRVVALDDDKAEALFRGNALPRLRWAKYMDLIRAGKRRSALLGMVSLVQSHPDHQEIDGWLDSLTSYLSGGQKPDLFDDIGKIEPESQLQESE